MHLFLFVGVAPPTVRFRETEDVVDQQYPSRVHSGEGAPLQVPRWPWRRWSPFFCSSSIARFMKYAIWHRSDTWRYVPFERPAVWGGLSDSKRRLSRQFASRRSWFDPCDLLVWITSAGDEGEGSSQPPSHGPQAQALRRRRTRTRLGPRRLRHQERARWPLETLGYTQPRDSHVQGEPDARAEPTAQLMPDERGGCACCTATKYRNTTTTTTHHPEGLDAALACSVADIVAVAGSSR